MKEQVVGTYYHVIILYLRNRIKQNSRNPSCNNKGSCLFSGQTTVASISEDGVVAKGQPSISIQSTTLPVHLRELKMLPLHKFLQPEDNLQNLPPTEFNELDEGLW